MAVRTYHALKREGDNTSDTPDAHGCEASDSCGNFIAEAEAASEDGSPGCVTAFLGVLIGVPEVRESCDGDKGCHPGKGAL